MHLALALFSLLLASVSWVWSVRRVRSVERRLADAEHRLTVADWLAHDEAAIQAGLRVADRKRLDRLERAGACRRVHAADLPAGMVRAPVKVSGWVDDEEAFNPLIR